MYDSSTLRRTRNVTRAGSRTGQGNRKKDLSTAAHTWRVVLYTWTLFESFNISRELIELVTKAAALHDIGKIDIPDEILQKQDVLTEEEFEVVKFHPITGFSRLTAPGVDEEPILNIVRFHHERWAGLSISLCWGTNPHRSSSIRCHQFFRCHDEHSAVQDFAR